MTESVTTMPRVSVVLVNYKGIDDTIAAISAIRGLNFPESACEVVVVDNASGDGSVERLRELGSSIVLVEQSENVGFAAGCNAGVRVSSGEIVAFLNNDARPDANWITAALAAFEEPNIGAVASRVLNEDGTTVDFVDAALTWFGKGYKPFVGERARGLGLEAKDLLFATGAAMFVRRSVFDEVGGFDASYFMFYEDVDLGWRINLRGYRVRYVPTSIAFHRHHGSAGKFAPYREEYFLERNALITLYKNLGERALQRVLPAAVMLGVRRAVSTGNLDSSSFDYRHRLDGDATESVVRDALAPLFGIDQFTELLPSLERERAAIQASRVVPDAAIWRLFGRVDAVAGDADYVDAHEALATAFDIDGASDGCRVLIITGDPIGAQMAGPAIRAWHMAGALAPHARVTLATTSKLERIEAPFTLTTLKPGDDRAMDALLADTDVVVFQGFAMAMFPQIGASDKIVVADAYDPLQLEQLEQGRDSPFVEWSQQVADATETIRAQLERADFILCASERQRMFYLGMLSSAGRLTPAMYAGDPNFESLLAVVPFGLPDEPPQHRRPALRDVVPGIGTDDAVVIWAGGIYNWFDPQSLIRAVAQLAQRRPSIRLFFQGTKHPHPGVPEMAAVRDARRLADQLGVAGVNVFFNESWVEYAERENFYTEANAGVSTHFMHVETTFSFRTRILDYLWAGLPMVVTEGDSFADLVRSEGLGVVVAPGDADALEAALEAVLFDEEFAQACRDRIAVVREDFRWSRTLEPLVDFVADPHRSVDAGEPARRASPGRATRGLRRDLRLAVHYLRQGGVGIVARKAWRRVGSR